MAKKNGKENPLQHSAYPTATFIIIYDASLLYAGCPNSADFADYSGAFMPDVFEEDFARHENAWERLANL